MTPRRAAPLFLLCILAAPLTAAVHYLPVGDVFRPLLAAPQERQFFMSFSGFHSDPLHCTLWSVGFGETLGLVRWDGKSHNTQLGFSAGVFSQFNWSTPSHDLLNTDFTFGAVATHRWNNFSGRLQLYHQSSHLGDELILTSTVTRINLSYESIEAIISWEQGPLRLYGGGEHRGDLDPSYLGKSTVRSGMEIRGPSGRGYLRPLAGADFQWKEDQNWYRNISIKAGVELGKTIPSGRRIRLMAEYYDGFSPFGQFFNLPVHYAGVGFYIGF